MNIESDLRTLPNTETVFTSGNSIPVQYPAGVEGQDMTGDVWLKVVMKCDTMLMLQVFRQKGVSDPMHRHDDHETTCHLISGRLRLTIGGDTFVAGPGDTWFHPIGVDHTSEALEDSLQIEVKSPPVKTWQSREDVL